jgi:hypothetical protein
VEAVTFPAGLSESSFLRAYHSTALRKPGVAADGLLRTALLAGQADRYAIGAAILLEVGEACRRLVHVFNALDDRRYSIARTLAGPLPGLEDWSFFAQLATTAPASALIARLYISDAALPFAERLRGLGDYELLGRAVAAHASPNPLLLVPGLDGGRQPDQIVLAGGEGEALRVGTGEADLAGLADVASEASSIARGLLGDYIRTRFGTTANAR